MKINERYFNRILGSWKWTARFQLVSSSGLLLAPILFEHKIRVFGLIFVQKLFGPFLMSSEVKFERASQIVLHHLELSKWDLVFYRSEKRITLDSNGTGLVLEGEEYFWPFLKRPQVFNDFTAQVSANFTSAKYQWPLFGACVQCETFLGGDQGTIRIDAKWLRCLFELTPVSMSELKKRSS